MKSEILLLVTEGEYEDIEVALYVKLSYCEHNEHCINHFVALIDKLKEQREVSLMPPAKRAMTRVRMLEKKADEP